METSVRDFSFSKEEAKAVAKCEVGSFDLPWNLSVVMAVCAVAVFFARKLMRLDMPALNVMIGYIVTLSGWIMFLTYIYKKEKDTAKSLVSRRLTLFVDDDGMEVIEYGKNSRFHCFYSDIEEIDKGDLIYRIVAKTGRICIPLRLLSAEEQARLDGLEAAKHKIRYWM